MSFLSIAVQVLSPVLLAAASWVATRLGKLISQQVHHESLKALLLRLDDSVFTAVKSIEQSIVEDIKKASADGVITPEEAAKIRASAVRRVKDTLGATALSHLKDLLALGEHGLEKMLESKVDAAVYELRQVRQNALSLRVPLPSRI